MGDNAEQLRARAEARFGKEAKQSADQERQREERAASSKATDDKIARLKGLRLAKELAAAAAEGAKPNKPSKRTRSKATT